MSYYDVPCCDDGDYEETEEEAALIAYQEYEEREEAAGRLPTPYKAWRAACLEEARSAKAARMPVVVEDLTTDDIPF